MTNNTRLKLSASSRQNFKMKIVLPIAFALFGAALAAPTQPQSADSNKRSEAQSPDILGTTTGGAERSEALQPRYPVQQPSQLGKRSRLGAPDYPVQQLKPAGGGSDLEAQSPDILCNNQAGWGKRSEAQSPGSCTTTRPAGASDLRLRVPIFFTTTRLVGGKRSEAPEPRYSLQQPGWLGKAFRGLKSRCST